MISLCSPPADERRGVGAVQRRLSAGGSGRSLLHHLHLPRREDNQVRDAPVGSPRLGFQAASSSSSSPPAGTKRTRSFQSTSRRSCTASPPSSACWPTPRCSTSVTDGWLLSSGPWPSLKSRKLVCPHPVLCVCKYFFLFFLHVHKTIIMKI